MIKPVAKTVNPLTNTNHKGIWRANLSAAHRGPRPGKQSVQKAPKLSSNKTRW